MAKKREAPEGYVVQEEPCEKSESRSDCIVKSVLERFRSVPNRKDRDGKLQVNSAKQETRRDAGSSSEDVLQK